MTRFLRTVNTEVAELAQQHTADVLALAFQKIDDRINALKKKVEDAIRAKKFLNHRMNEHSDAKRAGCTCELCEVYKEIDLLAKCRSAATYPFAFGEYEQRPYVRHLDERLFKLHNMRRALMGLPERIRKPNPYKFRRSASVDVSGSMRVG